MAHVLQKLETLNKVVKEVEAQKVKTKMVPALWGRKKTISRKTKKPKRILIQKTKTITKTQEAEM